MLLLLKSLLGKADSGFVGFVAGELVLIDSS